MITNPGKRKGSSAGAIATADVLVYVVFVIGILRPLLRDSLQAQSESLSVGIDLLPFALVVALVARRERRSAAGTLGWRMLSIDWLLYGALLGFALFILQVFLATHGAAAIPVPANRNPVGSVLTVIGLCVVTPLTEETVHRGFVFNWLRARLPLAVAVIMSGVEQGAEHAAFVSWATATPIFIEGALFAYVYRRSGSILPAVVAHSVQNAIALLRAGAF